MNMLQPGYTRTFVRASQATDARIEVRQLLPQDIKQVSGVRLIAFTAVARRPDAQAQGSWCAARRVIGVATTHLSGGERGWKLGLVRCSSPGRHGHPIAKEPLVFLRK